jgi:hypothetical protein
LKHIELQMQMGVVSRRGIQKIMRVSANTVAEWDRRGLEMMRPGTAESFCIQQILVEFMARNESFPGVKGGYKKTKISAMRIPK